MIFGGVHILVFSGVWPDNNESSFLTLFEIDLGMKKVMVL